MRFTYLGMVFVPRHEMARWFLYSRGGVARPGAPALGEAAWSSPSCSVGGGKPHKRGLSPIVVNHVPFDPPILSEKIAITVH